MWSLYKIFFESPDKIWFASHWDLVLFDGTSTFIEYQTPIEQFSMDITTDNNENLWISGWNGLGIFKPGGLNIDFSGFCN